MYIAVTGYARHGKDTVADYLVEQYGFTKLRLADPIKKACQSIFGWTQVYMEKHKDDVDPYWGITPRFAMQTLGTEWGQFTLMEDDLFKEMTGRLLWTKALWKQIEKNKNTYKNVVVPDLRFVHEHAFFKTKGFCTVRIYRHQLVEFRMTHASEAEISNISPDFIIYNDVEGSLQRIYEQIDIFMSFKYSK